MNLNNVQSKNDTQNAFCGYFSICRKKDWEKIQHGCNMDEMALNR